MSDLSPRRAPLVAILAIFVLFALFAALGSARPHLVARFAPALLILAIVIPVFAMQSVIDDVPRAKRGAVELDRIGAIMRAHRGERVTIHSPWAIAERALVEEPEFWTNRCISEFYGALSLRITR